jgi:hypothetical protein
MLDPRIDTAIRLLCGAWWGLTIGLLSGGWGTTLAIGSAVFGVAIAAEGWLASSAPTKTVSRYWSDRKPASRRDILRALAHGEPVKRQTDAYLAERIAREVGDAPVTARGAASTAAWCAAVAAAVVIAALDGAPPLWVALAGVFVVASAIVKILLTLPPAHDRLRRAAEVNGARVTRASS